MNSVGTYTDERTYGSSIASMRSGVGSLDGLSMLTTAGEVLDIDNPSKLPTPDRIEAMEEPYVRRGQHLVLHGRRGDDQREVELALQPLLHDLHVQHAEEPAAEAVAERERRLRLV